MGHLDIGNLVSELAEMNGTKSLHIMNMRRFRYNDKGEVMDFINNGYEVYPNIITLSDQANWVLLNLKPLRNLLVTGKLKATKDEKLLIIKNDWVLLTPLDGAYNESLN